MRSSLVRTLLLLCFVACSSPPSASAPGPLAPAAAPLRDEDGHDDTLEDRARRSNLTVLLFFSSDCPVLKAHDARVRELVTAYGARGIAFAAVVSETGVNVGAERAEAKRRMLGIPVLEDKNAALADALGVEYSTHVVVLDRERRILYSGAIDSDRSRLSPSAERWLQLALDASLDGKPIAKAKTEPLGCPLRKH